MKHVFILGSRGLPAQYGGFETFVQELINHQKAEDIQYHVACLSNTERQKHFSYKKADCFFIKVPNLGPARVIAYDILALDYALKYCKRENIQKPIFYMLGNTIGAFMKFYKWRIQSLGGNFFINPDGLEWKRSKWSKPVRAYLKYAEKSMTKIADLVISDNQGIEKYIQQNYPWSKTTYIAYGTDLTPSTLTLSSKQVIDYFSKYKIEAKSYYLILGRFVPENNYETMIKEFMASSTQRDLIIITNHEGQPYFNKLVETTNFISDSRVKFVGTVYDKELLKLIREQAFAYIHGHEVGGTNPGLLEALATTSLNLVLDVDFNHQVARDTVYYWTKEEGVLSKLIAYVEQLEPHLCDGTATKQNMKDNYTWSKIVDQYEDLFLNES